MNLASLAIKQALSGNFAAAVETNLEILKQEPDNIDALNRLAQACLKLHHTKKALAAYQKVLRLDRFNPIAKRNLEKIKTCRKKSKAKSPTISGLVDFVEEPGKTKLIFLVQPGEKKTLADLSVGEPLRFVVRGKVICLYSLADEYVGRLPDDLSRRLIWLAKRGNGYQANIKCIEKNRVLVFLRETKKVKINGNYTSFPASERGASFLSDQG